MLGGTRHRELRIDPRSCARLVVRACERHERGDICAARSERGLNQEARRLGLVSRGASQRCSNAIGVDERLDGLGVGSGCIRARRTRNDPLRRRKLEDVARDDGRVVDIKLSVAVHVELRRVGRDRRLYRGCVSARASNQRSAAKSLRVAHEEHAVTKRVRRAATGNVERTDGVHGDRKDGECAGCYDSGERRRRKQAGPRLKRKAGKWHGSNPRSTKESGVYANVIGS